MRRTLQMLVLSAIAAAPAFAHHSFAAHYFEDQTVSIEGELVELEYRSPHAWVHVMARDEHGQMQKFSAEWANVARLKQSGVAPDTLKPGDRVVITGSPTRKTGDHRMHLKSIQRPADGWTWSARRTRR